jgi:hypothetical protein
MRMWNHNLSHRLLPCLCSFEIHGFLEGPCFPFRIIVNGGEGGDVGKPRDAVEAGSAEVELTCLFWVGGQDVVALFGERGSDREEGFGILWARTIIDIPLNLMSMMRSESGR